MPTETQAVTTQPPVTEAKDKVFTVEPNAIEGLKLVEQIYPLGSKFLMIGLNEYDGRAAVLYDAKTGEAILSTDMRFTQTGENTALVDYGSIRFTLMEQGMKITADEDFIMDFRYGKTDHFFPVLVSCNDKVLRLRHNGMDYGIELTAGRFDGATKVCSEDGCIELNFI